MLTPSSVYDYNMDTQDKKLLKQSEVIGKGYDQSLYDAETIYATARDGEKIPIYLVYRKDLKKEGAQPLLLYSYGSYGSTSDPYFSSARLSLLDRGIIYALTNVRGSQIFGRQSYEDGKLLKKKNTFYDFIDAGKHLVNKKYTSPDQLFCSGGSAGGLLISAVVNMEPDLWKGAITAVPFVDVVTTMLDSSIPLTSNEWDEWGDPREEEYYHYMLSYSPYDQIEKKKYPNILVTSGFFDSQVQYWEPLKYVAKLRDFWEGNNKLYLYMNMDAGHGGKSGRFKIYKEIALEYAYLLDLVNIKS
jgi:oligopeptidase B|tara:strand:+ start:32 stop:937 length:906 start_codon:yes stop_codon:yes gene_type:complete